MLEHGREPHTCGNYETEEDACAAFDYLIEVKLKAWFKVFKEVKGVYVVNPHGLSTPGCRIDRILIPNRPLVDAGWQSGAIGVECKQSNVKAAKPLSQCIDYRDAAFKFGDSGMTIMLEQVFLWPFSCPGGALQSMIAQRRVGGIYQRREKVIFDLFQQEVLVFDEHSRLVKFHSNMLKTFGKKRGSR